MLVIPYTPDMRSAVEGVARAMRRRDRREFEAFGLDPPTHAMRMVDAAPDNTMVVFHGLTPVFVFGALQYGVPGVLQLFGFGTNKTGRILDDLRDYIVMDWGPSQFQTGARRIQVMLPVSNSQSVQWLMSLGMKPETVMREFGIHGEPVLLLAYTFQDWLAEHVLCSEGTGRAGSDRGSEKDRLGNPAGGGD